MNTLVLLVAVLLPLDVAPLPDPDTEVARRHFKRGAELYEGGDYPAAVREFEAARRVKPSPAFEYNIGRCYDRMERYAEAVAAYERFVAAGPSDSSVDEVRDRIRVLRERLRAFAPAAVERAPAAPAAPPSPPPRSPLRVAGFVVGGFAVASLATGVGLVASVAPEYNRLYDVTCTQRQCTRADYDAPLLRSQVGYAMWALAGAAAVVDIVLFVVDARRRPYPRPR